MIKKVLLILLCVFLFTGFTAACSTFEELEASEYTSDNEELGEVFEIDVSDSRYCVFEIENSELESETIVIEQGGTNRLEDETILFEVLKDYKTTKYVQSRSEEIESGLDEAYSDMREIERVKNSFGDIISKVHDVSNTVDVCVSPPQFDVVEVCAGDKLTELTARQTCMDIRNFLSCADWEKTIENFNNLRGLNNQLEDTNTVYEGEVSTYYERGIAIDHFLRVVDEEADTSISNHLDKDFEDIFDKNSKSASKEIRLIEQRVDSRHTALALKIDDKNEKIENLKEEIKTKRADGFIVQEEKEQVCNTDRAMPDKAMLEDEEFSMVEQELQFVERSIPEVNKSDLEKEGLTGMPSVWVDGIIWSVTGVC